MPLQLWVQASRLGLRVKEIGVPRVYLDMSRAFGGALDHAEQRLAYYRTVLADAERHWAEQSTETELCRESCP
jgi:dolichol-phosphate mannosyltransferase